MKVLGLFLFCSYMKVVNLEIYDELSGDHMLDF